MFKANVEAMRLCFVSLLADSTTLKRMANRKERSIDSENSTTASDMVAIKLIAERIDRTARKLFHLLPEDIRPTGIPRLHKPREPRPEGPEEREYRSPTPGGPIPQEVRWPTWTIERILALADAYKEKYGKWPNKSSGRINDTEPDTWTGIDIALRVGNRG